MSTVVLRGRVERVVERGKWVLVYLEDRLTPIAFPADADYIPKEGEVVEGRARRGNSWLFARPGWQIISVESKPSKDAKYLELPLSKLTLHPIHVELGRQANQELIENIKAQGILEPLIVRKVGDYYEVLAGSRRLDAAKKAGLTKVQCRIVEADDEKAALIALWENVHRDDLDPISFAKSLKFMIDNYGLTHEELAKKLNKSRTVITETLRLLKLPEKVQKLINVRRLTLNHGLILLRVAEKYPDVAERLADLCIECDWSVRQLEDFVNMHFCSNCKRWLENSVTTHVDGMHLCVDCYEDYRSFLKSHQKEAEATPFQVEVESGNLALLTPPPLH